jgi:3-phenylpropionate/trans-cinnamate dioxygenase ferredoxin reductase subunit
METQDCGLLVIGAGHAGSELAVAARQCGWADRIVLLGDEEALPDQRPPLSKAYLCGEADATALLLRPASAYEHARITVKTSARLLAIDRAAREVSLADGSVLRYGKLALCTGGRPRSLACDGLDAAHPPANLFYLRTLADAQDMRTALRPGARLVVIGGGYVGLEVAASAIKLGAEVTVLEAQPRVLARVAGPALSAFYQQVHRSHGVEVVTGAAVSRIECTGNLIVAVHCADGSRLPADVVVAGIGMVPNVEAARVAGLAEEGGIPVDELSRTADPDIVAAGDCTLQLHALYDRTVRLESVPNALEQARAAASWLAGKPKPNRTVPWFWSDQYDLKLQMAGLSQGYEQCVLRGDPASRSFSAFYLRQGRLLAVDAINRPGDFMLARRALSQAAVVEASALADEKSALKDLLFPRTASAVAGNP